MSEVTMTDFETIRKWIGVEYEDGRGDEAYEALSRIERVVEAARSIHVESQEAGGRIRITRSRYAALREALGALDG